ncbi:hydrogenase-1 expression HyaE [Actibacterium atlanticum]|uniref:Hydrogenase expression/formation protein n=1 Tax=Actibacterium atlanticum TaxID=1461693 RepID=A0A058ZJA3_9RHOB|nr:hydrogenase accessory protein [Actibacterium atlanticum]KCV81285.1 hydrogenase-1 expression HyaE [Actibacterium atlanticum]
MTHPLIDRLSSEMGWQDLNDRDALDAFIQQPGAHALFVPGDPKRNLETADVAVILPELKMAFQGQFDCAVVGDDIETELRQETKVLKTPSLIFYRDGQMIGNIPKVRDWDEYMVRIAQILAQPVAAE